jgi:hypothetical protein
MNFIAFSPHYPPNYLPFWVNLRRFGVNVLGLGDAPWDSLRPEVRSALNEYYAVWNAQDYDQLLRAVGYFTHRYGKIDRLESHNEFWLESDARLRTDFNIRGLRSEHIPAIKRKSEMKKMFARAGLQPIRGRVCRTLAEAHALADELGFPLIAKPDIGVGAFQTYRLQSRRDLEDFYARKPLVDYLLEEQIDGEIVTFDGLTNQNGKIVFCSSMRYGSVMDIVNNQTSFWYLITRQIEPDVEAAGRKIVSVYRLQERFFHFEFFRTPDGGLRPLEVNMRPPGGLTTDMFNFANDIDVFYEYANIVVNNRFDARITRPYACAYVGRRNAIPYRRSIEQITAAFPAQVVYHSVIDGAFAAAIGDYGFIVRSPYEEEVIEIAEFIIEQA